MKTVSILLVVSLASSGLAGDFSPITYPNVSSNSCPGTKPLYFGLLMSFDAEQFDGSGAIAGVNVALDRINSNCSLLPGYSLHYVVADSRCTRTGGLDALFEDTLFRPPHKIAVIGSGCSLATEPTAEVSHYYNISHLSCVSSSPDLTNRNRFRNYFQLLNSEVTIAHAYFAVIREYGWRHVSLIVQNENLFTETINILKEMLRKDGISFDERLFSSETGVEDLGAEPFNMERRIHLIACYASHARQLMCAAHAMGVYLPRHVLLTPAWYDPNWWRVNDTTTSCSPDDMETVLSDSLAFLHFDFLDRNGTNNITSRDGLTASEYLERESAYIGSPPLNLFLSDYAQYCYDATWTLLYALQNTLTDINDTSINQNLSRAFDLPSNQMFALSDFTYESNALQQIMFEHLNSTSFNGITGKVQFSSQGIREVTRLIIFQYRKNSSGLVNWVEIGEVTSNGTEFTYTGEGADTVWPNGIPYDGVPVNATATIHPAVTSIYFILATVGIVFAVVCIVFNFVFRERKLIRLTSPNLNLLIGIGAIILYFNLYLFIFPVRDPVAVAVLCNLTPWLTAIGYSLCYGTIVVKMTRVYYIFNNPTPKKTKVKDWKLFLGVLALVVIDVLILSLYAIIEGTTLYPDGLTGLQARQVVSQEYPEDIQGVGGQITTFFIYVCNTPARDIMLGVLYGYKALLQIIALIFSFSIRKVKVKGLDDAIFIAGSIYVSSIVLAVIFVCTYTLRDFLNIFPIVFCTGFLIGTSVILGLVFIPLMVGLYKDPNGDTIFDNSKSTAGTTMNKNLQTQTIEGLRGRVTELEAIVASTGGGLAASMNGRYRVTEAESPASIPTQLPAVTPDDQREMMLHQIAGEPPRERTNTIWDNDDSGEEEKKNDSNINDTNV